MLAELRQTLTEEWDDPTTVYGQHEEEAAAAVHGFSTTIHPFF